MTKKSLKAYPKSPKYPVKHQHTGIFFKQYEGTKKISEFFGFHQPVSFKIPGVRSPAVGVMLLFTSTFYKDDLQSFIRS